MKKNGGWTIELANPVDGIAAVSIAPLQLDHTIRWSRREIPSILALIAELSGTTEKQLKQLTGVDTDRIFIAFSFIASGTIKKDFEEGNRPLATPFEAMSEEDKYNEISGENDEIDPRFPKIDDPNLQRFKEPPAERTPEPAEADNGLNINAPDILRKVG